MSRVGVAYRSGETTLAEAYRAVLADPNGKGRWAEILERAALDDSQRKSAETIAACMQIATWHGRYDLASAAAGRLLREDIASGDVERAAALRAGRLRWARVGR